MRRFHVVLVAASLSLLLVACRSMTPVDRASTSAGLDITADGLSATELPDGSNGGVSQNGFYPLEVGNHWTYREVLVVKSVFVDGTPPVEATYQSAIDWELMCPETRFGRQYLVQKETTTTEDGPFVSWFRERQDPRGLYGLEIFDPPACAPTSASGVRGHAQLESSGRMSDGDAWRERAGSQLLAQLSRSMPAGRAATITTEILDHVERMRALAHDAGRHHGRPGGVQPGEILELSYPLRIGKQWVLRDDDVHVERRVVGLEVRDVLGKKTLTYRIRNLSDLFGDFTIDLLYSRRGLVGIEAMGSTDITDEQGNVIGTDFTTITRTLTAIHLDRPSSLEGELRVAE
jgi:hypothetical protein